jgi:hypothetical protein
MPDATLDADLDAFLIDHDLGAAMGTLAESGITSLRMLKALCDEADVKKELVDALRAGKNGKPASIAEKLAAKALEKLTAEAVQTRITALAAKVPPPPAPPVPLAPKAPEEVIDAEADPDLAAFLGEHGLDYYVPVFRYRGIFSLRLLAKLLSNRSARAVTLLRGDIANGCKVGNKTYKGSLSAAQLFDEIEADAVNREVERKATQRSEGRSKADADKLAESKKELEQAMREVEALRVECEKAARDGRDAAVKTAREELERVLKRANARELLDQLKFGDGATLKDVDALLAKVQQGLDAKMLASIEKLIDTRKRTPSELASEHGLMRGFILNAAGFGSVSGGDLLEMSVRALDAPPRTSFSLVCSSETHHDSAVRVVETARSAFSTANKAKGAAFIGSGIGAVSAAGNHARARQKESDEAEAAKTSRATHYRIDYIWEPQGSILLPSTEFRLSKSALRALGLLVTANGDERNRRARKFLQEFGSHVFSTVTLGGWYRHSASATSSSTETLHALDSALSEASSWAASVSGSYVGLAGAGMLGSANQGEKDSARGRSERQTYQVREQSVEITTSVLGGMSGLPIDHWKASVLHSAHWKPIDRDAPHAIWEILRDCDLPAELEKHRAALSGVLETCWINDIFLSSIDMKGDPKLKRLVGKTFADVEALTSAIERATASVSPPMLLTLFRKQFDPGQHFHGELVLDKAYKILSGGVEATQQTAGNLIVSSYPAIENGQWRWKAEMKDSRQGSKAVHIISVIALYDPDNEWDVKILSRTTGTAQPRQSQSIEPSGGYVITGGGVRVTPFEDTHVLGCGFGAAPGGDARAPRAWTATTAHYTFVQRIEHGFGLIPGMDIYSPGAPAHEQQLFAIVVRPPDAAQLLVEYHDNHRGAQQLHDHVVTHDGGRDPTLTMIGGGAMVTGTRHWLTGSNPAVDGGTLLGWHAASREHPNPAAAELDICTVAVRNAEWIAEQASSAA